MSSEARIGNVEPADADDDCGWQPSSDAGGATLHTCLDCGASATADYARVMGDDSGRVHACPECSIQEDRFRGATGGER